IKQARKDMVHIGSCHPAFVGMNKVLQTHTNIYAEDEPEDFERERNKKAENVYFIGCVGSFREDEPTLGTLDLLDRLKVDYTLIDEVCCSVGCWKTWAMRSTKTWQRKTWNASWPLGLKRS
nr:hypothetical protein [Desulfobacterales bacterium]